MTSAAMGKRQPGWTISDYILACVVDAVNANTHAYVQSLGKKKVTAPKPFPRPDETPERKKNQMFAIMARQAYNANKG